MTRSTTDQQRIEAEAAEWVVRLGDRLEPRQRLRLHRQLQRWRGRSTAHEAALQLAWHSWSSFAGNGAAALPAAVSRRPQVAVAAALLAAAVLIGVQANALKVQLLADHHTAVGEVRRIELPDGSRVRLNTDSAIALYFDDRERRIDLLAGEADFEAAPAGAAGGRPFVVTAGQGRVRALGTRFTVRADDDGATVTVLEHAVNVSCDCAGATTASRVLEAGQRTRYGGDGVDPAATVDAERASAWQRGLLVFDDLPLAAVVAELDRYRPGRIVVADEQLAQRRVSGVFRLAELDRALDRIAGELQAERWSTPLLTVLY